MASANAQYSRKTLIAHRGASGYAPEHTMAAYRLAIEQGADFVEQDLQITKDGVLVCLHDLSLERTTNVEEVFPDRFTTFANGTKTWLVSDFTLAEVKRLDSGSWFSEKFKGERVLTWQEAIEFIRGKAGLYPETKGPEVYGSRGFDMEALVLKQLASNKLDRPGADPKTPVIIQSFSPDSLRKMRQMGTRLPLILLVSEIGGGPAATDTASTDVARSAGPGWLSEEGLKATRMFADGIGPSKVLLEADPKLVQRAHAVGLSVTPYTFRITDARAGQSVRDEMARFLYEMGVDALFTDNPDQFPRRAQ
jgi:glycerophosphoryl diester phosphodiesterase